MTGSCSPHPHLAPDQAKPLKGWAFRDHHQAAGGIRAIFTARRAGMKAAFDFDLHARKRIDYTGVIFRIRSFAEIHDIMIRIRDDLWGHMTAGRIRVPVDATFPPAQASKAHAYVRANKHFGKVLVLP